MERKQNISGKRRLSEEEILERKRRLRQMERSVQETEAFDRQREAFRTSGRRSARPELGERRSFEEAYKELENRKPDREPDRFEPDEEDFSRRKNVQQEKTSRKQGKPLLQKKRLSPGKKKKNRKPSSINQKDKRTQQPQNGMAVIRSFLVRLAMLAVLLVVLFGVVFGITPMANADMQPSICAGDLMLYYRLEKDLNSDDVVVFKKDGETYTGRIVAKGGDTVEITSDSELKVNGSIVVENEIYYSTPQYDTDVRYPISLGEKEYFILCDSREGAKDSRYFGPVTQKEIKGKVITIIRRSGI